MMFGEKEKKEMYRHYSQFQENKSKWGESVALGIFMEEMTMNKSMLKNFLKISVHTIGANMRLIKGERHEKRFNDLHRN
jgi:hypothetical protein